MVGLVAEFSELEADGGEVGVGGELDGTFAISIFYYCLKGTHKLIMSEEEERNREVESREDFKNLQYFVQLVVLSITSFYSLLSIY